jgi:hypothetical protein
MILSRHQGCKNLVMSRESRRLVDGDILYRPIRDQVDWTTSLAMRVQYCMNARQLAVGFFSSRSTTTISMGALRASSFSPAFWIALNNPSP